MVTCAADRPHALSFDFAADNPTGTDPKRVADGGQFSPEEVDQTSVLLLKSAM
jgi:hypothetical protein